MTHDVLTAQSVNVRLDGRSVLHNVDMHVSAGEFVTLLGANGSGKTTLVRACMGLVPYSSGTIELFGTPREQFHSWQRIGYVPQRASAVSGVPATVGEVVLSGTLSRRPRLGWASAADRRAAHEALERVNMDQQRSTGLSQLSGGQQQRVMIARALASKADLLVLDEPTAGVDHAHTEALAQILRQLSADGTTVLLIEHELGPMRSLIDRAIVVRNGQIAYAGPVDNIVHAPHAHTHQHGPEFDTSTQGVWP